MLKVIGEARAEQDGEMGHRRFPCMVAAFPFRENVAQREVEQLARRFVRREMAARFEDLAQLHVKTLDRVRGIE